MSNAQAEQAQDAKKTVEIIVNGRKKEVEKDDLFFEDVVNLAFNNAPPTGPNIVITVTYSKGHGNAQGSLLPGQSVKAKEGMIFDVTATDKS